MRNQLLLLVLLASCSTESADPDSDPNAKPAQDPHSIVACDSAWGSSFTKCESACATKPADGSGKSDCHINDGVPDTCYNSHLVDDGTLYGCCVPGPGGVRYLECE